MTEISALDHILRFSDAICNLWLQMMACALFIVALSNRETQ